MRKIVFLCAVISITICWFSQPDSSLAGFWSESWLVKINGQEYTSDDYKNWWLHWNDKKKKHEPEALDKFIQQRLITQQAVEMEYDQHPEYLNKIRVYLKYRSLEELRYQETSKKIKISEEDVEQYFYETYSPIWLLQIMTFKDLVQAEEAYKIMQPFNGNPSGRLVFADFLGGEEDDGGPIAYEENIVVPGQLLKLKRENWLEVIKKLNPGDIAKPFAIKGKEGHAVILRLESQTRPDKVEIAKKKKRIESRLYKRQSQQLTNLFVRDMKIKYNVVINRELIKQVDSEKKYDEDFLKQSVISMNDLEVSVGDLITNMKRDMANRRGRVSQDFVKNNVVSNIVSQTLLDMEALSRDYEKLPPLKSTWEFYTQNMLRVTLLKGIKAKVRATDDEILNYYNKNIAQYSMEDTVTYRLLKGDPDLVDKIWKELLNSVDKDIDRVAAKYETASRELTVGLSRIPREILVAVGKTSPGEISIPFTYQQEAAIILLKGKKRGIALPLDEVKAKIGEELTDKKYKAEKDSYVKKLRSRSEIKVNDNVWNKLRKEL